MTEQWYDICNADDIQKLKEEFGGFHDACLVSAAWKSGVYVDGQNRMCFGNAQDRELQMIFHSQWQERVLELSFIGVRKHCLGGWQERYSYEMYGCLEMRTDLIAGQETQLIIWADSEGFCLEKEQGRGILQEPMSSYVIAEKLRWRMVDKENAGIRHSGKVQKLRSVITVRRRG